MFKIFIIIAIAILERADQFEFSITKDLKTSRELEREKWTHVEVIENDDDIIIINIRVPLSIPYSDLSVFFANEVKEILEVHLTETLRGKFYAMPHKAEKEMSGQNVTVFQMDGFQKISGIFPASWLPRNSTKISAAITDVDGHLYNYYGLNNFEISILDLLVLEEYKRYRYENEKFRMTE